METRWVLFIAYICTVEAYLPWNEDSDFTTTTIAGSTGGDSDGTSTNSSLFLPSAVAVDIAAQQLYIADTGNHKLRRLDLKGGNMSTLAGSIQGSADGIGTAARLNDPSGIAVDEHVGILYVADTGNMVIRSVHLSTGRVRTLAGSTGEALHHDPTNSSPLTSTVPFFVVVESLLPVHVIVRLSSQCRCVGLHRWKGTRCLFLAASRASAGSCEAAALRVRSLQPRGQ